MKMLKTFIVAAAVACAPLACAHAQDDTAKYLTIQPADHVLGSATAPVTMIEYASMSCPHCADFDTETLPKIKKNFIDPGYVKLIFRFLPWDNYALAVSKIVECAPEGEYYNFIDAFFSTQRQWISAPDPIAGMEHVARLGGMSKDQVNKCLEDPKLHQQLLNDRDVATKQVGVRATPTFFINGTKVEGAVPYENFDKLIKDKLHEADVQYHAPAINTGD